MGGVILEVNGTAYGDVQAFYEAWQKAITGRAAFVGGFANDTVDTEIDGLVITIRREFATRPDQMVVNATPEPQPTPTPVTMYCTASAGLKIRDKPIDGNRVGGLAYRVEVHILPSGVDGWGLIADVTYEGKQGYVSLSWLSTTCPN